MPPILRSPLLVYFANPKNFPAVRVASELPDLEFAQTNTKLPLLSNHTASVPIPHTLNRHFLWFYQDRSGLKHEIVNSAAVGSHSTSEFEFTHL